MATPVDVAQRFDVGRRVGRGGMGTVYQGFDRQSEQTVAIKILDSQTDLDVGRFLREAEILAQLRHPNIVRYVDHGLSPSGSHFLVMEWLDGEDLAARLARGSLPWEQALLLGRSIATALGAAHRALLVHRDVKPSNIFLVGGDPTTPKLLDFGIARRVSNEALTATGAIVGTPQYMAIEQALGGAIPDARSDVYSLGVVLFECLTGQRAHANALSALAQLATSTLPRVTSLVRGAPSALDTLVARAMARDSFARPSDGSSFAIEIESVLQVLRSGASERPTRVDATLSSVVSASPQRIATPLLSSTPPIFVANAGEALPDAHQALQLPFVGRDRELSQLSSSISSKDRSKSCIVRASPRVASPAPRSFAAR